MMFGIKHELTQTEKTQLGHLKMEIENKINSFKLLTNNIKVEKNKDIIEMIKHYLALTREIEDRRNRLHSFTLQMLAICSAAAALLYIQFHSNSVTIDPTIFYIIEFILISQIFFSIVSAIAYYLQNEFKYVFRDLDEYGNSWKWFYRGSKIIPKINYGLISRKKFENTKKPYLESYIEFLENYQNENIDRELIDNIKQLHVFRIHNYYKNKFYMQLNRIWQLSFLSIPIFIILRLILYFLFHF